LDQFTGLDQNGVWVPFLFRGDWPYWFKEPYYPLKLFPGPIGLETLIFHKGLFPLRPGGVYGFIGKGLEGLGNSIYIN